MQDTMYESYEYFCMYWCEYNDADVVAIVVLRFSCFCVYLKLNKKKKEKKKRNSLT